MKKKTKKASSANPFSKKAPKGYSLFNVLVAVNSKGERNLYQPFSGQRESDAIRDVADDLGHGAYVFRFELLVPIPPEMELPPVSVVAVVKEARSANAPKKASGTAEQVKA